MNQNFSAPEVLPPADNLWVPGTPPHGFRVEMLTERASPVATEQAFAPESAITAEVTRRLENRDRVRVADPSDAALPQEVVLEVDAQASINKPDLMEKIRSGKVHTIMQFYNVISEKFAKDFGLDGVFAEAEQEAVEAAGLKALQERYAPDWKELPEETLEHAKQISQVLQFRCGGRKVRLYNFTQTILTEEQSGQVANGLRELCDETGAAAMDAIKVMAIADVHDSLLYPVAEDGKHYSNNGGIAQDGGMVLSESLFDTTIPLPPVEARPGDDQTDTPEQPFHVPGDEIQLTVFHEGLHIAAPDREITNRYALETGWSFDPYLGWAHGEGVNGDGQGLPKNPFTYGQREPREDITVTGEANFAGGKARERLDDHRKTALRGVYAAVHSKEQGPNFITVHELPLPPSDQTYGMPPSENVVIQPKITYRVLNPALVPA